MSDMITIDNKEYAVDSLSDEAKSQVVNIRLTDAKIQQLQQEIAIVQTARNAYSKALQAALPVQMDETIKFN